ncbi:hypothetical protein [Trinickia mobilis]|uniref:hypothetical protein n=1 Tax=Trinickia mobilis TaxID=2816356 RepID=UPI001F5D570A|nr:hypothetical protein [Trinickia mobilis]
MTAWGRGGKPSAASPGTPDARSIMIKNALPRKREGSTRLCAPPDARADGEPLHSLAFDADDGNSMRGHWAGKARAAVRPSTAGTIAAALVAASAVLAGCAATPAAPVAFRPVPVERILKPDVTQPAAGKVAVDVRRERTDNVIVRFRDALVYVDGVQVTDLQNGEHVVFYLSPGVHRLAVSTQFDPVIEIRFTVDARYTNVASVAFDKDHRVGLRRVPH